MLKTKLNQSIHIGIFFILNSVICLPVSAQASPWIGSTDPQLYYDLVTLAEWGYIDATTTTFPLPWKGIKKQLNQLDTSQLPRSAAIAANRLKQLLKFQQKNKNPTSSKVYIASDESRFTSFDGQHREKTQINVTQLLNLGRWSAQLSVNQQLEGKTHFDQSYINYQFDDWHLRLGAIEQWWGPAHSSSLILSNNARPVPAIALSRSQVVASTSPWLKFLGPWYFTVQLCQLENNRAIAKTKLWLSRFSFRPIKSLEIGASWTAMWGGRRSR